MSVCRQCNTEGCCIPCGDQDWLPKPPAGAETTKRETKAARRARLQLVLDRLAAEGAPFLDLCELVELYARDTVHGMVKWTSPRVIVHIKRKRAPKKVKA